MNQVTLKIGELAKLAQVSQDTLRFYEKHGLLKPHLRSDAGYRLYSEADVQRVSFILSAKRVGFTLNEIAELLALEVTKDENPARTLSDLSMLRLLQWSNGFATCGGLKSRYKH